MQGGKGRRTNVQIRKRDRLNSKYFHVIHFVVNKGRYLCTGVEKAIETKKRQQCEGG